MQVTDLENVWEIYWCDIFVECKIHRWEYRENFNPYMLMSYLKLNCVVLVRREIKNLPAHPVWKYSIRDLTITNMANVRSFSL